MVEKLHLFRYLLKDITVPLNANHKMMCRLWINGENGSYIGEGKIRLLQAIEAMGSISKAAKTMHLSYKKAWGMVDAMNKEGKEPLVETLAGGKNGGGAILTDSGRRMLVNYLAFKKRCFDFIEKEVEKYDFT